MRACPAPARFHPPTLLVDTFSKKSIIVFVSALGAFFSKKIPMKIVEYLKETRGELKHVSWPTRRQTIVFTMVVILISIGVAVFLGFFDFIFAEILRKFVL